MLHPLVLALLASASAASADAIRYIPKDLGTLGGATSQANAINANGTVVGWAKDSGGNTRPFICPLNGTMQDLGDVTGGNGGEANAINGSGHAAGKAFLTAVYHPFYFGGAAMVDIGTLGGNFGLARGINSGDVIVGEADITGNTATHAFLDNGTLQDLGTLGGTNSFGYAINNSSDVVGYSFTTGNAAVHPFLYHNGAMTDLGVLGGTSGGIAYAINDTGLITGSASATDGGGHAFLYKNGVMKDLGVVSGTNSTGFAINGPGVIVGFSEVNGGASNSAMIYSGGKMRDLATMLPAGSRWKLLEAHGINDRGLIVGYGYPPGTTTDFHAFLLTPKNIPSPTVAIAGKAKIRTHKAKLIIKGITGGEVSSIDYTIGKTSGTLTGAGSFSFKAKLKRGRTTITVTAHGYGGNSAPATVVIKRT